MSRRSKLEVEAEASELQPERKLRHSARPCPAECSISDRNRCGPAALPDLRIAGDSEGCRSPHGTACAPVRSNRTTCGSTSRCWSVRDHSRPNPARRRRSTRPEPRKTAIEEGLALDVIAPSGALLRISEDIGALTGRERVAAVGVFHMAYGQPVRISAMTPRPQPPARAFRAPLLMSNRRPAPKGSSYTALAATR